MIKSRLPGVTVPDQALPDFVLARAGELGGKPAFIDATDGRTMSYAELEQSVRRLAAGLAARGFGKGDVLALYAPNLPEYAVAFLGAATVGGITTTANPMLTADELRTQLLDSGARLLVTVPALLDKAAAAADGTAVEEVVTIGDAQGATPFAALLQDGEPPAVPLDLAEDLVALPYSSGTTGLPKGVMLTHRNLVANICQTVACLRTTDEDRVIAVLPFFHIYGLVVILNASLRQGATLVTMQRFDLPGFLGALQEHRITRAYVVPPVALALAKHPLVDDYDLSSIRSMLCGAAPLSAELEAACAARVGCGMQQGYGMTEASPVTHLVPDELAGELPGSVGLLAPNTECRLVDLATGEDVPAGAPGEVLIRGPQVMKGYLGRPDATAATVDADGWLHTGDVATVDEDGVFRVVDRVKELIKFKGYQIAPAELEALLITHPAISDAAVIPVEDEEAGEAPKAFVSCSAPLTPEEVLAFVAERVAPYKKLRAVEIVDEIPKSPSGKILRRLLIDRERAAAAAS